MRLTQGPNQRTNARMVNIQSEIAEIERVVKGADKSLKWLCEEVGIAPSTFGRWKAERTVPNMATWSRVKEVVSELAATQ